MSDIHAFGLELYLQGANSMTAAFLDKELQLLDKWSSSNPLGRIGQPDELRGVIAWLASDASSFCTGSEYVNSRVSTM